MKEDKLSEVRRIELNRICKEISKSLYESIDVTNVINYDSAYSESFKVTRRILKIRYNEVIEENDSRYEEYYELTQRIFNQAFRKVVRNEFEF